MAKGVMFSPGAAARIKASVRKTEGALRTQTETQRGQILGGSKATSVVKVAVTRDIEPYEPICYYDLEDGTVKEYRSTRFAESGYYYDSYCYPVAFAPAGGAKSGDTVDFNTGHVPARAKVATHVASSFETHMSNVSLTYQWGFCSTMSGVSPYLPGFTCLGEFDSATNTAMFVHAGFSSFTGTITDSDGVATNSGAVVFPCIGTLYKYDGSGGFPSVKYGVNFVQRSLMSADSTDLYSTNMVNGDILVVYAAGMYYVSSEPAVFDAPVGTIRIIGPGVTIPRGWKLMDGSSNSAFGSGINMVDKFARGRNSGGWADGTIAKGDGTDGYFDFVELRFIERISKNV